MTSSSAVRFRDAATLFVVQDVLRSVEHYRDVLGFRVDFTYGEPTFYAGVERDNVAIHLQAASETKRLPGHGAINVFVTGVDTLYQELKSKGVRTMEEPADRPYGMRDFDINDLDGISSASGSRRAADPPAASSAACRRPGSPGA